eukprot:TRINITY_DN3694_c0_g1_i1.p1 TRINITY_DN3694_c0_g1~~TRINITY_DN3694_c0_g1_i1.p1  ORF type:complete len:146 (-),score=40.23 TRINITY_DN3694_c0_g1_i1:238-675(-)
MKRTKEAYYRQHPEWKLMEGCSGIKELEGEDLSYDSRQKYNKDLQRKWIEEKIEENKMKQSQEKLEESNYAQQAQELNRMRGMLEDEFNQKKANMRKSQQETNQQFAKEKQDKTLSEKQSKLSYEKDEVELTKTRGFKKPYPPQQ